MKQHTKYCEILRKTVDGEFAVTCDCPEGQAVTDEMVEAALKARVPGGSEVWCWLPQKDAFTPHQTARDVMRCALEAAFAAKP